MINNPQEAKCLVDQCRYILVQCPASLTNNIHRQVPTTGSQVLGSH